MKALLTVLLFSCAFNLFALQPKEEEGKIISYKLFRSYDKKAIGELWKEKKIPKFIAPVKYGVDIYEVVYMAPWVDGTMIKASGLYFVPKAKPGEKLPVAVYHHGTQLERQRESFDRSGQQGIAFGLAADGFITLMPDYYGIGEGEKMHLYQHAWSEAMSTIYMLFAVDQLNDELNISRTPDIYLTGYSQGGHATMAAHKYLQEMNDPDYQVVASAPMSGAYDMSGVQAKVMFEPYPQPFYLPYILVSYQEAYNMWDGDIYEVFREPYDTIIPAFMDGNAKAGAFNKVLPEVPAEVLKPEFLDAFKNDPDFVLAKKIENNNLYQWVPEAPTLLCYCEGDEQVTYKNSEVAYDWMKQNGAPDVRKKNISNYFGHTQCALFSVMEMKFFFNNIRTGRLHKTSGPLLKRKLVGIYKRKKEKEAIEKRREQLRQTELRAEAQQ